jgi:hypothetical protein
MYLITTDGKSTLKKPGFRLKIVSDWIYPTILLIGIVRLISRVYRKNAWGLQQSHLGKQITLFCRAFDNEPKK